MASNLARQGRYGEATEGYAKALGIQRKTRRSFPLSFDFAGGNSELAGGGNTPLSVWPVRGAGCERGRSANAC